MSQAAKTERDTSRAIGRGVGLGAAVLVVAEVFAGALAAHANITSSYALQRSLVNLAAGGGALVDPAFAALIPMFVVTYGAALAAFAGGLVLCWCAGRLAAASGAERVGAATGRRVMFVASVTWMGLSLLAYVVIQLDGTFSWLVGTLGAIALSSSTPVNGTVYSAHPNLAYVVVQVAALLVQELLGTLVAVALGGVAGRLGARAVSLRGGELVPPAH